MAAERRHQRLDAAPHRDDERDATGQADDDDGARRRAQPGDPSQRQRASGTGCLVTQPASRHLDDRRNAHQPGPRADAGHEEPADRKDRAADGPPGHDAGVGREYCKHPERQIWVTEVGPYVVGHPTTLPTW